METIVQNLKYQYLVENLHILKLLGVDFGTKKFGFAILNWSFDAVVLPLCVIKKHKEDINLISEIVISNSCNGIVIGNCDNSSNLKSVIKLQDQIQKFLNIPVFLQDERLTTYAANEILKDIGMKKKDREMIDDAIAAQLILEDFLCDFKRYMYNNQK